MKPKVNDMIRTIQKRTMNSSEKRYSQSNIESSPELGFFDKKITEVYALRLLVILVTW
jgi:hypothetical protein